jgi:hypothetical protein
MILKRRYTIRMNVGTRARALDDRSRETLPRQHSRRPASAAERCGYCSSKRNIGADHINGRESDGHPDNLMSAYKRCSAKKAALIKKARLDSREKSPKRDSSRYAGSSYGA